MDRRVTSPAWGYPPRCKQAIRNYKKSSALRFTLIHTFSFRNRASVLAFSGL